MFPLKVLQRLSQLRPVAPRHRTPLQMPIHNHPPHPGVPLGLTKGRRHVPRIGYGRWTGTSGRQWLIVYNNNKREENKKTIGKPHDFFKCPPKLDTYTYTFQRKVCLNFCLNLSKKNHFTVSFSSYKFFLVSPTQQTVYLQILKKGGRDQGVKTIND